MAQEYNADGNVVGPTGTSLDSRRQQDAANNWVTPSAYGSDNYISNMATNANGTGDDQLSQGITITLSKGYSFTGTFSFDYEIFPDISCTAAEFHPLRHLQLYDRASMPISRTWISRPMAALRAHHILGHNAIIHGTDGSSVKSPDSNNELAPQCIGESGNFTLTGATVLSFQDWPAAIGVDNLKLVTTTTPEPRGYAFILGGLMLALFVGTKLRQSHGQVSELERRPSRLLHRATSSPEEVAFFIFFEGSSTTVRFPQKAACYIPNVKGVVLAGGTGSRLFPLTKITNKHLLPIYDKPMIYYPIQTLVDAGIREILVVTGGRNSGDFLRLLANGSEFGLKHLDYTYQEGEGGIADALALAEHFADGQKICVMLGDNIIEGNMRAGGGRFQAAGPRAPRSC